MLNSAPIYVTVIVFDLCLISLFATGCSLSLSLGKQLTHTVRSLTQYHLNSILQSSLYIALTITAVTEVQSERAG